MREGIAELDGEREAVGGIVLMRPGQNALDTIAAVKARIGDLERGLPEGVELVTVYDRSGLIHRAINTPSSRLVEELLIVALVCAAFLLHLRSSLVVILCLPIGILMAFVAMRLQGVSANIMSLGGIAIGAMVDASIVMVDSLHKHIEREPLTAANRLALVQWAAMEVGPALLFSLLKRFCVGRAPKHRHPLAHLARPPAGDAGRINDLGSVDRSFSRQTYSGTESMERSS